MSKTMQEIVDGTRWTVGDDDSPVCLYGDDFATDVRLEVRGDFATSDDHLAYAQALADRLNGGAE